MAYITRADIEAIYGANNLARLVPTGADATLAIATAIDQACGEADMYVGVQVAVPLDVVPEGLKAALIDLAYYRLGITHDRLTEEMSERAKAARKLLGDISSGKASLGLPVPEGAAEPAGPNGASSPDGAYFSARPRLFGR